MASTSKKAAAQQSSSHTESEESEAPIPPPKAKTSKTSRCVQRSPSLDEEQGGPKGDDDEVTVEFIRTKDFSAVSKVAECDHLTDDNWHEWKERMRRVFINCNVAGYVYDSVQKPNKDKNQVAANNWEKNDSWAQQVIMQNVTSSQMNHVGSKPTAASMYSALEDTHKNKAHLTANHLQTLLHETKAAETDNILK